MKEVGLLVAVIWKRKLLHCLPMVEVGVVITGAGGRIVKLSVTEPVPPALVAFKVTLKVPLAVGVPEMRPVAVFTESPAGRPVALKLIGLLVAVI